MKKLLITGGNGYIAKSCANFFSATCEVHVINRQLFDLTDFKSTQEFLRNKYFDAVIHTAIVGGSRLTLDLQENVYKNLIMFENLFECRSSFNKFISFGSGAEIYASCTPYGLSKKIINKLINNTTNAYNLRVYGVFDENELSTRFIKSCINSIKNNKTINIHQNKLFDYFYMEDLLKLILYCIEHDNPSTPIDCCYTDKFSLLDIANKICYFINQRVDCRVQLENYLLGEPYVGNSNLPPLDYIGLDQGIINTIKRVT